MPARRRRFGKRRETIDPCDSCQTAVLLGLPSATISLHSTALVASTRCVNYYFTFSSARNKYLFFNFFFFGNNHVHGHLHVFFFRFYFLYYLKSHSLVWVISNSEL